MYSSNEAAPLCKFLEQYRTITYGDIAFEDVGDTSVVSECSLGVNLIIYHFVM